MVTRQLSVQHRQCIILFLLDLILHLKLLKSSYTIRNEGYFHLNINHHVFGNNVPEQCTHINRLILITCVYKHIVCLPSDHYYSYY